jgi:hypothetical protein
MGHDYKSKTAIVDHHLPDCRLITMAVSYDLPPLLLSVKKPPGFVAARSETLAGTPPPPRPPKGFLS